MRFPPAGQFVVRASLVALLALVPLSALAWPSGATAVRWGLAGWLVMTVVGVVGGGFMVLEHGRATPGFIVALGTCMLARLIVSAAGAFAAVSAGGPAVRAYVTGLGVGYVPLQVFETVWFMRRAGGPGQ